MRIIKYYRFIIIVFFSIAIKAQDTLKVSSHQAEGLFLKNSFRLLASSMNIESQKAQIIQAKLYPNPVFTAEFNAYNPENNKYFQVGATGQKLFQIEQLILLGGKRKTEIEIAKTNTAIAELEFQQLVQNLRYQLQCNLHIVGQYQFLLDKYNDQLISLDNLLSAYQIQVDKGNIALKELVRLKGAYLKLNNQRSEIFQQFSAAQSVLQNILQTDSTVQFEFSEKDIENYIKLVTLDVLKTTAYENRAEFLILKQNSLLFHQYVQYQQKIAIPDINVFTYYNQSGGVFKNEIGAGISLPLPLWNRNQGHIKASKFKLQEADYQLKVMQNEIHSDIQNAFTNYNQIVSEYQKANSLYNQDFEITITGMINNFTKRNVSIIEFIDFFEAYNEVLTELTRIRIELVSTSEELNLLIGKNVY